IVADMHDPVAPVLGALFHDHRPHDAGRVIAGFGEVADDEARLIEANLAGTGAVKIDLSHFRSPLDQTNRHLQKIPAADSAEYSGRFPNGNLRASHCNVTSNLSDWFISHRDSDHADSIKF